MINYHVTYIAKFFLIFRVTIFVKRLAAKINNNIMSIWDLNMLCLAMAVLFKAQASCDK